jgi:hypothetical protein
MSQAARAVCEYCGGLRHEPPGVQQFMVIGEQVWLHLQCRYYYEKAHLLRVNPLRNMEAMNEQTRT